MGKDSVVTLAMRVEEECRSTLHDVLRDGARRMLQVAIEAEAADSDTRSALLSPLMRRR